MDITPAQATIIKEICKIQFTSLEDILITDLEEDYHLILESYGCNRKDFDQSIIGMRYAFQAVHDDPIRVFELPHPFLIVFKFILEGAKEQWVERYPNALNNLSNKILIHQLLSNEDLRN